MVEIPSVGEFIYKKIRSRILDGSYASGDRLNVDELARQLKASKTPVREALGRLVSERLVVFRPRSGWSVPSLSLDEFLNFLEMQYALRLFMSDHLAAYVDQLDFELLDSINNKLLMCLAERQYHEVVRQNDLFHLTILRVHPNRLILSRLEELDALIRMQRVRFFEKEHEFFPTVAQDAYAQHQKMLESLRTRNPEHISRMSKNHHGSILRAYKHMSKSGLIEPEQGRADDLGLERSA